MLIDTPELCLESDFCRKIDEGIEACCIVRVDLKDDELYRMIDVDYCYEINNVRHSNFQEGWNACIDKILFENYMKMSR